MINAIKVFSWILLVDGILAFIGLVFLNGEAPLQWFAIILSVITVCNSFMVIRYLKKDVSPPTSKEWI